MLFYQKPINGHRDSGDMIKLEGENMVLMTIEDGKVALMRFDKGKLVESYAPVNADKAVSYSEALLMGREPLRGPHC